MTTWRLEPDERVHALAEASDYYVQQPELDWGEIMGQQAWEDLIAEENVEMVVKKVLEARDLLASVKEKS